MIRLAHVVLMYMINMVCCGAYFSICYVGNFFCFLFELYYMKTIAADPYLVMMRVTIALRNLTPSPLEPMSTMISCPVSKSSRDSTGWKLCPQNCWRSHWSCSNWYMLSSVTNNQHIYINILQVDHLFF